MPPIQGRRYFFKRWFKSDFMITISSGKVFIDDQEVSNPELIGNAFLDFAEEFSDRSESLHLKVVDAECKIVGHGE